MPSIQQSSIAASAFLIMAVVAAPPARATTSTVNMSVGIQITAACNVSVTNINFGSVSATTLLTSQTSTSAMGGLFTYTCSPGANPPALSYDHGLNYSATNNMKGVTNGGAIPYSLTMPTLPASFTGTAETAQITATIPALTTLPSVDIYSDTVTLTLTY